MQISPIQDLSDDQVLEQINELQGLLAAGGTLGDAANIPREQREALYQLGHGFYAQARYEEAFRVFNLLVVYEHTNEQYLMAFAGAAQMLGRYKDALQHYATATMLLLDDPRPVFYSAECFIALGETELAIETLNLAIELSRDAEPYAALKSRAVSLLDSLRAKGKPHAQKPAL